MLKAYGRLIQITIMTLSILSIMIFALRQLGQTQQYAPWKHPLLEVKELQIVTFENKKATPLNEVKPLSNPFKIIYFPVRFLYDQRKWVLDQHPESQQQQFQLEIKDALTTLKNEKGLYLHVINERGEVQSLLQHVGEFFNDEQIIFESNSDHFFHQVKTLKPRWLYVSTQTQWQKISFLSHIFLETLTQWDADLVKIKESEWNKLPLNLKDEIQKRFIHPLFIKDQSNGLLYEKP